MTIDEALTDLSIQLEMSHRLGHSRQADAIKLGIEALKAIENWRHTGDGRIFNDLLGETEN